MKAAFVVLALVLTPSLSAAGAGLPGGHYNCYLFFGKPP